MARALRPWPGTFTEWQRSKGPMRLILERVAVIPLPDSNPDCPPGTVMQVQHDRLVVATGQDALALYQLKPAGKRVLDVTEFLRGYPVQVGDRLA